MAEAVNRLVADADLRTQLGTAGKAYISAHYTVARSVQELLAVYEWVLNVIPPA